MVSSALPPLVGGGKDDRDEQRSGKVKPLPLMLSTRAPLLQPVGPSPSSAGAGRTCSSPAHQPAGTDSSTPASPSSPGSQQPPNSYRSKFTRIRGFSGAPGGVGGQAQLLTLEGSAFQHQQQQQALGGGSRPATVPAPVLAGGGGGLDPQPLQPLQPHAGWGALQAPPAWGSPPQSAGVGASGRAGSAGGAPTQINLVLPAEAAMPLLAQANGSGGWAGRRSGAGAGRATPPRDLAALEGLGAGGGAGGGSSDTPRSVGSTALPRSYAAAASAALVTRPDTAPSSAPPQPHDVLSATYPAARGPGAAPLPLRPGGLPAGALPEPTYPALVPPPQQHLELTGSLLIPGNGLNGAAGNAAASAGVYPLEGAYPAQLMADTPLGSLRAVEEAPPHQPLPSPQYHAQQAAAAAGASPAHLLQRLYRTNRTPPGQPGPGPGPAPGSGALELHAAAVPQPGASLTSPPPASPLLTPLTGRGRPLHAAATPSSRPATSATAFSAIAPAAGGSTGGGSAPPRSRGGAAAGTLADLSAALQKSIAAGMGEWDLRSDGIWSHPELQQRLLRGPLGPEALRNRYRLEERDIISLYRLLYSYSVGFFSDVEAFVQTAMPPRGPAPPGAPPAVAAALGPAAGLRQELLENVFRAYAALWDEAFMIVFESEMASLLSDKNAALQALDAGVVELEGLRRENEQLQARLADFVRQNIDNMLATRHMKQTATKLEGEVHTLNSANEQLVTHMAGHAVQVSTLERQLDAARAATAAAEARAAAAEAHLGSLRAVLSEQNATLSAQYFQIKELERLSGELQDTIRHLNRRRAAALGLLSSNTPDHSETGHVAPPAAGAAPLLPAAGTVPAAGAAQTLSGGEATAGAAGGGAGTPAPPAPKPGGAGGAAGSGAPKPLTAAAVLADVSLLDADELERLLADKTRALHLLHADFLVKGHELEEQRTVNAGLREEISRMQGEVARANEAAAESDRIADKYKARWEGGRMLMEDLEGANRRLTQKNAELVRSYWPLMTRLREAEAEAAEAREAAERDRRAAAADRSEADLLRAEAAGNREALRELRQLREEAASHELEVPADLLSALSEGQVASLRRFARSCHRRVAHLNSQVVALVDQVTEARVLINQLQSVAASGGGGAAAAAAIAAAAGAAATAAANAAVAAGAIGPDGEPDTGAGGDGSLPAHELRLALAARDKWIGALVRGMSTMMSQMENLMARDWETCRTLRLEQQKRRKRAARAERREAAGLAAEGSSPPRSPTRGQRGGRAGGGGGDDGGGGDVPATVSAEPTLALAASPDGAVVGKEGSAGAAAAEGSGAVDAVSAVASREGGVSQEQSQERSQQPPHQGQEGGGQGAGEEEEEQEEEGPDDPSQTVACGRLAQQLGIGGGAEWVQRNPALLSLDRGFERLADSAERLVEWAEGLLKRKEQTSTFGQLKSRLESVSRQLEGATAELASLRPAAEALELQVKSYEAKFEDMAATMASCQRRTESAEGRLFSTEAQLAAVQQQLADCRAEQKLLEGEYWKAKEVSLDAEMTTGELKAGRTRALEAAAKALSSVAGLEKIARENQEQRVSLEADLVGYKAWVRHMEGVERKYRELLREAAQMRADLEERGRQLEEANDRGAALEQQLRLKGIEAGALEARVRALGGVLAEERRAAAEAAAAERASAAAQLDAAIRQAGGAEAEAAVQAERVAALEERLAEASAAASAAQAAADAAEARLVPLTRDRDRLTAHLAATQPLLLAMDRAATAIGRRLALLEDAVQQAPGSGPDGPGDPWVGGTPRGSLDVAMGRLLAAVDRALDAVAGVAAEAAGDSTPALLGALEGLVAQLLSTLSKGGTEPLQSIAVLKAQLARDDKELAALRATMAELQAASGQAAKQAAEQRAAAQEAAAAAAATAAAARRDAHRAAEAEGALLRARSELEATGRQLQEARQAAADSARQLERLHKRVTDLESDLEAARTQRRHHEATVQAAQQQRAELQRRADDVQTQAARGREAAREASERAAKAEAAAAAAAVRCGELEAAVAAEQRGVQRLRADAEAAIAATAEARARAVELEQQVLEMQSKYADMVRHDEFNEEHLRHARFEAETMRKRAAEAAAEVAEVNARYEELQQRAWQMRVALQAKDGEREEVLKELVEVTHVAAARKAAAT